MKNAIKFTRKEEEIATGKFAEKIDGSVGRRKWPQNCFKTGLETFLKHFSPWVPFRSPLEAKNEWNSVKQQFVGFERLS